MKIEVEVKRSNDLCLRQTGFELTREDGSGFLAAVTIPATHLHVRHLGPGGKHIAAYNVPLVPIVEAIAEQVT